MPQDCNPQDDDAFDTLANKFVAPIVANPVNFGLTAAQGTALGNALYDWTTKRAEQQTKVTAARAATTAKDTAKGALTVLMREDGGFIQARPATTDEQRTSLGLPIHSDERTPVGAPTTAPVLEALGTNRLQTTATWRDSATPNSKARPEGVRALDLYMKVGGAPPTGPEEMEPLGQINRSPNVEHHEPPDGGLTAYYLGRWVSTRGEFGPWSNIADCTIPKLL